MHHTSRLKAVQQGKLSWRGTGAAARCHQVLSYPSSRLSCRPLEHTDDESQASCVCSGFVLVLVLVAGGAAVGRALAHSSSWMSSGWSGTPLMPAVQFGAKEF